MTFYVENETDVNYEFNIEEIVEAIAVEILDSEQCPYEVQINVLLTDNEGLCRTLKRLRN